MTSPALQKGRAKTGGRVKGSINKLTAVHRRMIERMKLDATDPMSFMLSILRNPDAPYSERKWAASELMPYTHPKLASIEARSGGQTHEDRLKQIQEMLADEPGLLAKPPKVIDIPPEAPAIGVLEEMVEALDGPKSDG